MFFFTRAMRFARVNDQLSFDTVMFESTIKSHGLAYGISVIVLAMNDEDRRFGVANKGRGRITREDFRMIQRCSEIPFVASRPVLGFELGRLIKDATANYRRPKTMGLSCGPYGHFSSI